MWYDMIFEIIRTRQKLRPQFICAESNQNKNQINVNKEFSFSLRLTRTEANRAELSKICRIDSIGEGAILLHFKPRRIYPAQWALVNHQLNIMNLFQPNGRESDLFSSFKEDFYILLLLLLALRNTNWSNPTIWLHIASLAAEWIRCKMK